MKTLFAAQSLHHEGQRAMTTERLVNMYPEASPGARLPVTLRSVPGLSQTGQFAAGRTWAMESTADGIYASVGGNLVLWNGSTFTTLGVLPNKATTMAWNGSQLAIASGGTYYVWDGTSLTAPTGGVFEDVGSVDYVDGYIIRTELAGDDRFDLSALNDATTIDPLDFASAEARPDLLKRVLVFGGLIWLMGARTVEPWQNVGATDFPLTRMSTTVLEKGLRDTFESAKLDNTIFWNSDEGRAYRQSDFRPEKISTHAVDATLEGNSDACVFTYQWQGHDFYVIRFQDRAAWVFDAATMSWHERASGVDYGAWEVTATCHHDGKWYAGTKDGYLCTFTGYQDRGSEVMREATARNVSQGGDRFAVDTVDVRCDAGAGGTVMSSYSSDGGRTFSMERTRVLGAVGSYGTRTQWRALGQHREFAFRLACTDNVDFAIYEAGVNGNP